MAYGKIKADTLVYDNSGSDTELTISSIASKASLPASAGTVGASEVVQVDANKDITGFRNITLTGNLTVNGTTTTIESTTLTVDDKNIVLGDVDSPNDSTADGGGITLKGSPDKTITWTDATDSWDFNQNIIIQSGPDSFLTIKGGEGGSAILNLISDEADDNADSYRLLVPDTSQFNIQTYSSGSWVSVVTLDSSNNATFVGSVTDSKGDVRDIPVNAGTSAMTLAASDAGKVVATTTGGWIIPTGLSQGNTFTLLNDSGSDQTINATALTTLYNTADGANVKASTLTLGARSMATIWMGSGTVGYIQASALTVS